MSTQSTSPPGTLPVPLRDALAAELARGPDLADARAELSDRYRAQGRTPGRPATFMERDAHRLAYIAARMPATFAADDVVFGEAAARLAEGRRVRSLLDFGAGPGTALWAAAANFPELDRATLVERDAALAGLGRRLARGADSAAVREARWVASDVRQLPKLDPADLVTASYVLGELAESERDRLVDAAWELASELLVIVEPGTPHGFAAIRAARARLLARGAHPVAPCPHAQECPVAGADWCHFTVRVTRSAAHRRAKGGTLPYEDEKFSYVAVARHPARTAPARIVRAPMKRSGHVALDLCIDGRLERHTVSRRDGAVYRDARDAEWGDGWDPGHEREER